MGFLIYQESCDVDGEILNGLSLRVPGHASTIEGAFDNSAKETVQWLSNLRGSHYAVGKKRIKVVCHRALH